jgi:hypothetical protein
VYCPNRECPDFMEDGAPGEYVDTVVVCPKCGAALVAELPAGEPDRELGVEAVAAEGDEVCPSGVFPLGPLVALAAFDRLEETEPFVEALAQAGVTVFQFIDDGRDFQDRSGIPTCTRLLVPENQAKQALAILHAVGLGA